MPPPLGEQGLCELPNQDLQRTLLQQIRHNGCFHRPPGYNKEHYACTHPADGRLDVWPGFAGGQQHCNDHSESTGAEFDEREPRVDAYDDGTGSLVCQFRDENHFQTILRRDDQFVRSAKETEDNAAGQKVVCE